MFYTYLIVNKQLVLETTSKYDLIVEFHFNEKRQLRYCSSYLN